MQEHDMAGQRGAEQGARQDAEQPARAEAEQDMGRGAAPEGTRQAPEAQPESLPTEEQSRLEALPDEVTVASEDSFPASDPPAWTRDSLS